MMEASLAILIPVWPVLATCFGLGLPFGWLGWREHSAGFFGRLGLLLAIAMLSGAAVLAVAGRVPGRAGLWLEIGLASVLAYLVGCVLGSALRAPLVRRKRAMAAPASAA